MPARVSLSPLHSHSRQPSWPPARRRRTHRPPARHIEGVMLAMGRRVLLVGSYVDRVLTLKGELSTNRGRTKWTGERLEAR